MNKRMIISMCLNRTNWKTFLGIHKRFRMHPEYRIRNMIACGFNIIKHDRIVRHDGYYVINSFIPPINSKAFQTIVDHVPGEKEKFFENHTSGVRLAPISTYLAASDKCMYHCWHCSAHKFMKDAKVGSEFSAVEVKHIVSKLQNLGVGILGFTGGEPLLRKDLEDVIRTIDDRSVSYVFTTGYELTLERARSLKDAGLFGIAISIDSLDERAHNDMRRNNQAYAWAIKAIQNAKKAGLYTMSQTVCTREMLLSNGMFELAKYLKELGVDEMRIMEPLPCGALKDHMEAVLNEQEKEQLIQLHIDLNKNPQYPKASVFPYFESADQFGCGAGVQHSYVDGLGNFGPCDFMDETYGNLLKEEAPIIWDRIMKTVDGPHCECIAKHCHACKKLPRFYQLMKGKKHDKRG